MEFTPANPIVQLCIQGMNFEADDQPGEAAATFLRAWDEATNEFEKYLAAWYLARTQNNVADKLKWYQTALELALKINDDSVKGAFPSLYTHIAKCYEELNDDDNAKKNYALANSFTGKPSDTGPFYHGTKADLKVGDLLTPGFNSNYKSDLTMNHIYFTALANGAGLAAALAKGEGRERVYVVQPTGEFENDPNLTNNKFPGNPTRSYRTAAPLKIIGEVIDWRKQTEDDVKKWREKLENNKGEIIN
jgi:rifampin ADP-ribosylating transferase